MNTSRLVEHLQLMGRLYQLEERPHRAEDKGTRETVRHGIAGKPENKQFLTRDASEVPHYVRAHAQPGCPVFR